MKPGETPRRLGRGLGALLAPAPVGARPGANEASVGGVQRIPIAAIEPSRYQPRKAFPARELEELAASLRSSGLLQPISVRPHGGERFELLAGERRLRAAAHLGWTEIPAIVREVDERTASTLALVENLQRTDLNPIEEAEGYAQLAQTFGLTQQDIADAVGKDRSTVANTLRLLNLPSSVRGMVRDGLLSTGHARALLALRSEREVVAAAREAVSKGLTVREIEGLNSNATTTVQRHKRATKASKRLDAHGKEIEDRLRKYLQTDVRLALTARDRGQLSILFYSNEDLERVLELILGRTGDGL